MLKRTALFEEHRALGGRLIDFGGWELPVQYTGVMDEHLACRSAAGLFDVSHMGEVLVQGPDAEAFLNYLVTNNISKIAVNQAQYTLMCNPEGGVVDDLVIYRKSPTDFLVVVNASNTDKDFAWMQKIHSSSAFKNCTLNNASPEFTQIAIQGPKAAQILQTLTDTPLSEIKTYWFAQGTLNLTQPVHALLARTGYTGEDGFEIYVPWQKGPEVWRALMTAGAPFGIKPCGLGARDTLRLEMKYPLYGHELNDTTNPLEAGLSWVIKLDKAGDFIGKAALLRAKEMGLKSSLVGIQLLDRGVPRADYLIYDATGTQEIGRITSGTQSPSLKLPVGIGYVRKDHEKPGTEVTIDIRGNKLRAQVIATPFVNKKK